MADAHPHTWSWVQLTESQHWRVPFCWIHSRCAACELNDDRWEFNKNRYRECWLKTWVIARLFLLQKTDSRCSRCSAQLFESWRERNNQSEGGTKWAKSWFEFPTSFDGKYWSTYIDEVCWSRWRSRFYAVYYSFGAFCSRRRWFWQDNFCCCCYKAVELTLLCQ